MPEGPELRFASFFINKICEDKVFGGKPIKSEVSKNCVIDWSCENYKINAETRGKELMLRLHQVESKNYLKILFRFGMSGNFQLADEDSLPKHAHLRFLTVQEEPQKALCFVDFRRFGSWSVVEDWSPDRGPDPVLEYNLFRQNILENLNDRIFNKPICEIMLNQKYFNGIGNYLRAEILHRAGIQPFEEARSVLETLLLENPGEPKRIKKEEAFVDILKLCHDVPLEVMNLNVALYDPLARGSDFDKFTSWLQCYNKLGMTSMRDSNKRTIWFEGSSPGPLAPKKATMVCKVEKSPKKKDVKIKPEIKMPKTKPRNRKEKAVSEEINVRVTRQRSASIKSETSPYWNVK